MINSFISITDLQRHLKKVFQSAKPFQIVLSNNKVTGMVISKETAELLLQSGALEQLREELWELNDKETVGLVRRVRKGDFKHSVPFEDFAREYDV